jgi:hypothetical protein
MCKHARWKIPLRHAQRSKIWIPTRKTESLTNQRDGSRESLTKFAEITFPEPSSSQPVSRFCITALGILTVKCGNEKLWSEGWRQVSILPFFMLFVEEQSRLRQPQNIRPRGHESWGFSHFNLRELWILCRGAVFPSTLPKVIAFCSLHAESCSFH